MTETSIPCKPCIIVHGGAGNVSMSKRKPVLDTVKKAAKIGYHVLLEGRSALDAVEAATRNMEDSGLLNAGCGGYLTEEGTIELDAMIMDGYGETLNTGAVICVQNIANPISLARKVMTDTPHCMLAGEGALKFARNIGFPVLDDSSSLISDHSHKMYMEDKIKREKVNEGTDSDSTGTANEDVLQEKSGHDTVGAVAMDTSGRIAVSSSTGGAPYKMCGRVGDSPLIGSGAYANHQAGASCTGHGESILKVLLAREVVYNVESVFFRWLRDERGGKCFSHTSLGVWVRVYGGFQVT